MITFPSFLILLGAVSLPVIFILSVSFWIGGNTEAELDTTSASAGTRRQEHQHPMGDHTLAHA